MRGEKVDFERLCMKVEEGVVNGRIGPVKAEYSEDELPLDRDFATVLLEIKRPPGRQSIRVVTAPFFLGTKMEAFRGRGKMDFRPVTILTTSLL